MEMPSGEQRGIELIPDSERHGEPRDIFWMWFGGTFNVQMVAFGALLATFGLSFAQTVLVIVIGNVSWLLCGLASLPGPAAGTTAFVIQRAPFGPVLARGTTLLNWITQVTFEISSFILAVLAAIELVQRIGVSVDTSLKYVIIALAAGLQLIIPAAGHKVLIRAMKLLTPLFGVMFVVLAILVLPKVHHLDQGHSGNLALIFEGLAFVFSVGGFSWMANATDYTRYLDRKTSRSKIVGSVALGGFIPCTILMVLGALVASISTAASNPIEGMTSIFASWFVIPYLIVSMVQLFAITSIDLYSSGVTLLALGVKIKRSRAVAVDLVFCSIVSGIAIFSSNINTFISDMLLFVMVWLAPWGAIFIADWQLRRGRYHGESFFAGRTGLYWHGSGVNWSAAVALLAGAGVSLCWINTSVFVGPLSKATGGADLSSPIGFLVAGVLYCLLARGHAVPYEASAELFMSDVVAVPATVGEIA